MNKPAIATTPTTESEPQPALTPLPDNQVRRLLAGVRATAGTIDTLAPATGEPLISLPQSSSDDVLAAFVTARQAQRSWAATPPAKRVKPFCDSPICCCRAKTKD
jgi:succinate-semialdehyde dehydrogenase / glutarate-semialdehyde dehydrogenase